MASSIFAPLLVCLCAATIIQAYPLLPPGNYPYYYYYTPGGYYYGPQQMVPYVQTTNDLAPVSGTKPIIPTTTAGDVPQNTVPGIDIQRIREFFQTLFPFLRPTPPASAVVVPPATTGTTASASPITPTFLYGPNSPQMQYREDPAANNFYGFGYPMMPLNYPAQPQI